MRLTALALIALAGGAVCAAASDVDDNTLRGIVRIPDAPQEPLSRLRVLLNGGEFETIPLGDGSFSFPGLAAGSYTLRVHHPKFIFTPVRIDFSTQEAGKVRAFAEFDVPKRRLPYPLKLAPVTKAVYTPPPKPFNPMSMLKSPYAIMVLVTVLLFALQSCVDPEKLKEMQAEAQREQQEQQLQQDGRERVQQRRQAR